MLMKTTFKNILGWGSVLALAAGFTSSAIAGPGPQYWQQMERARAERAKAAVVAPTAKPADTPAMACASCKTSKVEEFSPMNVSGKYAPHYTTVGSKHECSACGGAVATVRGKTTNDMKANCPICAKAKTAGAACCNVTG
jgi:hypothetical protein